MLAFLDSPFGLAVFFIAVLLLFGPQKVPEIANQLGKALREFKRSTSEITDSFRFDAEPRYDSHYDPPKYDSYGNPYDSAATTPAADSTALPGPSVQQAPRGDFAASAMAADTTEYGVMPPAKPAAAPTYGVIATETPASVQARPAPGSVPRDGSA